MTKGEWSCLISFTWNPLFLFGQAGIEKFQMKIYVSSGIRTQATPRNDQWNSTLDARPRWIDIKWGIYSLTVSWYNVYEYKWTYDTGIGYALIANAKFCNIYYTS